MNYKFPQAVATPLKQLIPSAGAEGLALMRDMMSWDPHRRPTAQQVRLVVVVVVVVDVIIVIVVVVVVVIVVAAIPVAVAVVVVSSSSSSSW